MYWTDLVVDARSSFTTLESTFGHRLAYTDVGSHSGYNAVRRLMLERTSGRGRSPYANVIGPVVTPRRAAEAVVSGLADVAPLDSYAHALLKLHDVELAARLRVVARTEPTPIPPLVAHETVPNRIVEKLRAALLSANSVPEASRLLERLSLDGFAEVTRDDYDVTLRWSSQADEAGFELVETNSRDIQSAL